MSRFSMPITCLDPEKSTVKVGSYVQPDGWGSTHVLRPETWEAADFRIDTGQVVIESLAVKVQVTGRTFQKFDGALWVRVAITFVGDCEPDQTSGGWLWVQ